ncbi:CPBP family glutamic-type intramembrane protease [Dictyobacter kobayashii]|uniref:CAAX prenyl protease 2/Lysostaphin resistance protein A-like domain-containing protein n=1 Tax=Dictyobacter kobayashii TaxID=2014872 RepID=A0A402AZG5_9CHLR|nr:CPBP family intramembrane glutamic endopeptidase [Dictyobacter kobayashii]GCE24496.1 hypothetical protein KDK_82960 [Dictyobacter kobayashii]
MTYTISWLGALLVVLPTVIQGRAITQINGLLMFPVLLLGPSVTGIVLTGMLDGREGLRELFSRIGHWRVNVRWYAAILIPPVLVLAVLFSLHALLSSSFSPHLNPKGILYGIVPGFLEEIGWMGFAFPRMQRGRSVLSAGLLLGLLWGIWHLPVIDFLGAAYPHGMFWLSFALSFIVAMMAIRLLIVWVYSHTQSILLAQLIHISSTGSLVVFSPLFITPAQEALWYGIYAGTLWLAVALIIVCDSKHLVYESP